MLLKNSESDPVLQFCPALLERIRKNDPDLTVINLLNVIREGIGDTGLQELSEALKFNNTVKKIILQNNGITDVGVWYLCEALKVNKSIICIDLGSNNISDKGGKYISETLEGNTSLLSLCLDYNRLTGKGLRPVYISPDRDRGN